MRCPECSGIPVLTSAGETVCSECGLVMRERELDPSDGVVRRYDRSGTQEGGMGGSLVSELTPTLGLTTVIPEGEIEGLDLRRAARWDRRLEWGEKRSLASLTEARRIAAQLRLPDLVSVRGMRFYRRIAEGGHLRGRSILGMVAAGVYFACRDMSLPVTYSDIAEVSAVEPSRLRGCIKVMAVKLGLRAVPIRPAELVPRTVSEMELPVAVGSSAVRMIRVLEREARTSGKDPKGICAAAVYLASKGHGIKMTQVEVSSRVGVTSCTLRARCSDIKSALARSPFGRVDGGAVFLFSGAPPELCTGRPTASSPPEPAP